MKTYCCQSSSFAQNIRYLDEVFDDVIITEDIVYGNAPDLPFIFLFEWNTQDIDLDMDIYEPAGDTLSSRPAIVFIHTGAFFSGHNELDDVVDLSITPISTSLSYEYLLFLLILSKFFLFFFINPIVFTSCFSVNLSRSRSN